MKSLLCAALLGLSYINCENYTLPEENKNSLELIKYWGYPAERHHVITKDKYILTIHRIPRGNPNTDPSYRTEPNNRPVVFLQHGLLCSSSNWITNLPDQSLGFLLADARFDVWLGNVRGNTYSRTHLNYDIDSDAYWKFSFDEMAAYDLPAMVDYVLNITKKEHLYYVGHSQGTMMAFAGLSENEELRKKIKTVFALAPVARLTNTKSPVRFLSYFSDLFKFTFSFFNVREFLPSSNLIKYVAENGCPLEEWMCDNVLFLIAGFDKSNLNATRTPVYYSHTPAGTSVQNMLHFAQLIQNEGTFSKYDYGFLKNFYKYGSSSPPAYQLKNVKVPVVLISGSKDTLADPKDVAWLKTQLPHVLKFKQIKGYNHLDFIWGMSAREKVYKHLIAIIKKYEKN